MVPTVAFMIPLQATPGNNQLKLGKTQAMLANTQVIPDNAEVKPTVTPRARYWRLVMCIQKRTFRDKIYVAYSRTRFIVANMGGGGE